MIALIIQAYIVICGIILIIVFGYLGMMFLERILGDEPESRNAD